MINFVIIGCGRIAKRHAKHIHNNGRLVAVCDIIKERADRFAKEWSATAYYSIEDLLDREKSIDAVVVCTPNGLHAKHSILALKYGAHVLCEKPMAIKSSDCRKMIEAAEKAGKRLLIVKQNRFNPPVAKVKEILDQRILGEIFSVQLSCFWNRNADYYKNSWKGTADLDGGTLFTQFSHFIDLLYWYFGDIKNIAAFKANFNHKGIIEFEDTGIVSIVFHNGTLGTIHYTVNSHKKNMEGSLTIFGKKGTIKIGGQYLNELEYQDIEDYYISDLPTGNPPNNYGEYKGSMSNHDKVYENFVDVLVNNAPLATSGFEGLKVVEIIERIYKP